MLGAGGVSIKGEEKSPSGAGCLKGGVKVLLREISVCSAGYVLFCFY